MVPALRAFGVFFILICVFWSWSAQAEDTWHASLGATSDYVWRGLSQTNGSAAVSGGLEFVAANNLYVGGWVSNTKQGTQGVNSSELDLYLGISGENQGTGYDFGVIHYRYPQSDDLNFQEFYVSLMIEKFTIKMSDSYESGNYLEGSIRTKLHLNTKHEAMLNLHLGRYIRDEGDNYVDASVTLRIDELSFSVSDTDLGSSDPNNKSMKFFVSWDRIFDF